MFEFQPVPPGVLQATLTFSKYTNGVSIEDMSLYSSGTSFVTVINFIGVNTCFSIRFVRFSKNRLTCGLLNPIDLLKLVDSGVRRDKFGIFDMFCVVLGNVNELRKA
ncbi:hypothetical protein ANN_23456 [Periplaneta americana]|uniref:Uncharacterized protein n=1 Tax=Periplaneta americana TaxID=6978 RepID=A0ABQ8SMC0_PERAM|nr:hypothetical protein ANN_23456 [Periplaneta americana]